MDCHLKIVFPDGATREFEFSAEELEGLTRQAAREWIGEQFQAAGCTPSNPVGKLLIADTVLILAKAQLPKTFLEPSEWGRQFLRAVAVAFGTRAVTLDLASQVIGY